MKPVQQTLFGSINGNCFAACVASILEIDSPDDVPNFVFEHHDGHWFKAFQIWLRRHWRLDPVFLARPEDENLSLAHHTWRPMGWSIVVLKTGPSEHAVVCCDGQVVHDPSPRTYAHDEMSVCGWLVFTPMTDLLDDWIAHRKACYTQ